MTAAHVPWHKLAADLLDRGLGGLDPSFVFDWPVARVFAVFFLSAVSGEARLDTPEQKLEWINRQRAKRGDPPLDRLPPPKTRRAI